MYVSLPDCFSYRAFFSFVIVVVAASCNEAEHVVPQSRIGQWQYISQTHGLASDDVNLIFEDSKGSFWIGTTGGITVFNGSDVTTYSRADGLLDNNVFAIAEDHDGNIWVGTGRGVNIFSEGQWFYFGYFYNAPVYALLNMKNEQGMLIATGGYGVYRYDYTDENFSLFSYIEDCEPCNSINALFQSKDESVWVGSFHGARKIRGTFVTQFDETDGLPGSVATTITEDSWGNIWIGTVEGKTIGKITGNSVSQIAFYNGADENFIFGIQEDNDGNLWIGTVRNGLYHYDGAIMKQMYQGPANSTITALFKDSRGNLWIGTSGDGLAKYITNPVRSPI